MRIVDRSDSGDQSLSLRHGTRTVGGLFKLPRSFPLDAWACGACGYTELYARQPEELLTSTDETARPDSQPGAVMADSTRRLLLIALLATLIIAAGLLAAMAFFLAR